MTKLILTLTLALSLAGQAGAAEPIVKYRSIDGNEYATRAEAERADKISPIVDALLEEFSIPVFGRMKEYHDPSPRDIAAYIYDNYARYAECAICHQEGK